MKMTKTQLALGLIWLLVDILVLPLIMPLFNTFTNLGLNFAELSAIHTGIDFIFLLCIMFNFLRLEFYAMLDRKRVLFIILIAGWMINYVFSLGSDILMELLLPGRYVGNPNDALINEYMLQNKGAIIASAVFMGPVVEEILYRGCVFAPLRRKSRLLAYVVSTALFSLAHVWQFAFVMQDLNLLIFAIAYIPASFALAWCYEASDSLWTSIFLHMLMNVPLIFLA